MDSEPEGGSLLNIQPETSNDLSSEKVKPLKPGDKEIGGLAEIDDSPKIVNKEIGQGDVLLPPTVIVSSPNDDTQEPKSSDDLEVILDSADDEEDLHLKWDDDEEIEEDIISLDIPASPPKDNQDELVALTEKDKEHLVEIDEFENEINNEDINDITRKSLCPKVTDDLILIEDLEEDVIPSSSKAEKVTNNEDIIVRDMSYEKTEEYNDKVILNVDNSKNVDDTQETNTVIDVQHKMKIDIAKDESEPPKDIIIDVIHSKIETKADSKTTEIEMEVDNSSNIPISDKSTADKKGLVTSSPNESLSDASTIDPIQDHGLNKPDMMLEIPTQEVIDFLDDTDESTDLNKSKETTEKIDIEDKVTDDNTSSVTNEKNIGFAADSKLSPDTKDVADKIVITDTAKIRKVQEETKEKGEAMDVTEDIKEAKRDTTPEHTASNDEIVKSVIADEKKSTTELQETDKPELTASNDKTVKSVTEPQDIDKGLNTASKTEIPEKPIDKLESLTFVVPPLVTDIPETPIIEQSTSFNFIVPALTETTDTESKIVTCEEKPSTSEEIQPVSSIKQQPSSNDNDSERNSQAIQLESKSCDTEVKRSQEMEGTKNELQEVTDSLGLLAESTRLMEDDEEPEDEEDDDDDFDQDESSNQMTAEHSEDSNAQQSETDGPKEPDEKGTESPQEEKEDFTFTISNIETDAPEKDGEDKGDVHDKEGDMQDKDGDVDVDEIVDEVEVSPEIIGDISAIEESAVIATDDIVSEDIAQNKPSEVKQATDVETVKLSDTSDNEVDGSSLLRSMLAKPSKEPPLTEKTTPVKKLEITQTLSTAFNFVDLEESSSEDDVQVVSKKESTPPVKETSSKDLKDVATVAADIPKTPNKTRTPRINTSEISIRTISSAEAAALPQIQPTEEKQAPKLGLEVFSLDSDEEDATKPADPLQEPQKPRIKHKCINLSCKSAGSRGFLKADAATIAYYDAAKKKRTMVCEECADAVIRRTQSLVDGMKEFTPLLHLDIVKLSTELVEISDSESEDEADVSEEVEVKEVIGEKGIKLLEEHLADMINMTWKKFKMDDRLTEAQDMLNGELKLLEEQSKEIDTMLNECQLATDKLRKELYATFEHDREEVTPLIIVDTPGNKSSYLETEIQAETTPSAKRRMSSGNETPAKRPHTEPIPLGYTPIDNKDAAKDNTDEQDKTTPSDASKLDDDKDISVLQVSAEVAPASLPPPGALARPPLRAGAPVYGMRNVFGSWLRGRILEVQGKSTVPGSSHMFTICKVKFEGKARNPVKLLPARCLAYSEPPEVRMTIGTRVIALFKDTNDIKRDSFYSGVISEVPNPVNKYRYLIFCDDGYAQYVRHADTRLICECAPLVWEEVHPFSREFVREYLMAYPERPMVRLHAGQSLKTEWNGKWWSSRVIKVDASLVQVHFEEDNRTEWIYRGSTRLAPLYLELQAAERHRARPMPRTKAQPRINMPYVEYTRSECSDKTEEQTQSSSPTVEQQRETRQRAVAKKSTTPAPAPAPAPAPQPAPAENVTSRVVYYTPKNAVKPLKMSPHTCGLHCRRPDVLALKDLRTYNPLAKPLLSGWERQIVRFKGHKEVMYRAPCGRRLRNMRELHRYLRAVHSDMAVDLFDFAPGTHCLAEFVLNSCLVGKKDLSHGKENVPVPCVNYYDESLPEFCSYNTERTPTAGVPLNLDPDFLCGCDCTDDCEDKSKCGCWRMTLEGARTIGLEGNVGYVYRRLPEPLPTGIYECNPRCKCKQTCLNRVAQHPLQLKLQVFKTLNRGWGIRALNDVPKGSFLCVYAGNLLTDATANMDGLNEGDEYLAELDYIEVVEQMKEGFEEDIPDADKRLDKKNQAKPSDDSSEEVSSSEEEDTTQDDREDDDFRPDPGETIRIMEFSKRLRKRDKKKQKEEAKENEKQKEATPKTEDDCITISDDEEVREPSHFMAQAGMASNQFKSKYRSVRSYFGKDEACYIMDAKVQGNIGRYLNHSCTPNVFVQNVFVDTHDPRFPWVAFFALCHIKAGTELTWNYNYDVGSVPGKVLYCYCGAHNCRGRLL